MKFRAHVIETSAGFVTNCEALNEDYKFAGMSQNFAYEGDFRTEKEKCFSRVVLSGGGEDLPVGREKNGAESMYLLQ